MSAFNVGAGACPMGASPCGFGVPGSIGSAVPAALRKPDATIGAAAAINPKTGDYELDANGHRIGSDPVTPMVFLAIRTIKGSAATTDLGIGELPATLDDDAGARLRALVDAALAALVTAGLVEVVNTAVARAGTSAATLTVEWRDLTSGKLQTTLV